MDMDNYTGFTYLVEKRIGDFSHMRCKSENVCDLMAD